MLQTFFKMPRQVESLYLRNRSGCNEAARKSCLRHGGTWVRPFTLPPFLQWAALLPLRAPPTPSTNQTRTGSAGERAAAVGQVVASLQ